MDEKLKEGISPLIIGHILIRDPDTEEVLLNQRESNPPKKDKKDDE